LMIENPIPWPNGMRCAVAFTFDMDAETLLHVNFRESAPDRVALSSMLRYGPEIAVPRILDLFGRHGLTQTFFVPGWCIETYPSTVERILNAGHEIGHHGYLHKRPNLQSRDEEQDSLARGIEAIVKISGRRPVGYRAPAYAFSKNTLSLLQEEGFTYDSSLFGGDIPYLICDNAGDLVELPTELALDDWTQYVCLGEFGYMLPIASPVRAMEVFRAEFDAAWRHGGLWNAVWHPFVSGRLARSDAIADLIDYMAGKGGVWFASLQEIAAHVRQVIADGSWKARRDSLPYWSAPMPSGSPV
jgi:peptidoglycan/xylan/chitin deacetylase (PgdA/CDA1 family)